VCVCVCCVVVCVCLCEFVLYCVCVSVCVCVVVCLSVNIKDQKRIGLYLQSGKRKINCHVKVLYPAKLSFKNENEIQIFLNKQKLREVAATRHSMQKKKRKTE